MFIMKKYIVMLSKIKNMDSQEKLIMDSLLNVDRDIFIKFFKTSALVDENFTSDIREYTKKLFQQHSDGNKDFDSFIIKVHQSINNECFEELNSNNKSNVSTQTARDVSTQTCSEECGDSFILNTMAHRIIDTNINRRNRGKETFDVLKFLKNRKKREDYYILEFQSDDDVEEEMIEKSFSLSKKNLDLFGFADLRRISEHIARLNKMHNYQVLNVCSDRM